MCIRDSCQSICNPTKKLEQEHRITHGQMKTSIASFTYSINNKSYKFMIVHGTGTSKMTIICRNNQSTIDAT